MLISLLLISFCDINLNICVDKANKKSYNYSIMIIKNILQSTESYTHDNWVYKNVNVGFSRLYYIIDGEAYYEEMGKKYRLKKGHVYLTPVKRPFTLTEDPKNKLLHTYSHIVTFPPVEAFTEIEVIPNTPLFDAVELWRKYIDNPDFDIKLSTTQFVLSCIDSQSAGNNNIAIKAKAYIDELSGFELDMQRLSRALGYSREHITRAFSSVYRVTPKQYFNTHRMNIALSELVSGKKVFEVAEDVGFSSQYAFSKAFKKYFGLSPEKYLPTLSNKEYEEYLNYEKK